jgi:hypothetical protein
MHALSSAITAGKSSRMFISRGEAPLGVAPPLGLNRNEIHKTALVLFQSPCVRNAGAFSLILAVNCDPP